MTQGTYKQFCPVAMAAEVLCTRWTMLVVRELVAGSTRFNDLRRGLPRMSPALLSKRLKDLEAAGIVRRVASPIEPAVLEYNLTRSGRDLAAVVDSIGNWGQHWVETTATLKNLDAPLLMWDMRRNLDAAALPKARCVIRFIYSEQPAGRRHWWLVAAPGAEVDLCLVDPGFDVDLYVATDLRTMTAIWLGLMTVRNAIQAGKLTLTGNRQLAAGMQTWLRLSPFAAEKKLAAG